MSTRPSVYLAGPIAGLSYVAASGDWRAEFSGLMAFRHGSSLQMVSPMRGKTFLSGQQSLAGSAAGLEAYGHPMATGKGIVARDFHDIQQCSAVVMNFVGATRVSIGTCIELGFAHTLRKPAVLIMELHGNIHEHVFIDEIAAYRVSDIESAAELVFHLLTPGV